jgi:hypothetical protein
MGKGTLIGALVLAAGAAQADPLEYQTSDGKAFFFAGAEVGGLLYPASDPTDWHELMPDCTALRPDGSKGTWEWANGGWRVMYGDAVAVGFPRQEAPLGSPDACLAQ